MTHFDFVHLYIIFCSFFFSHLHTFFSEGQSIVCTYFCNVNATKTQEMFRGRMKAFHITQSIVPRYVCQLVSQQQVLTGFPIKREEMQKQNISWRNSSDLAQGCIVLHVLCSPCPTYHPSVIWERLLRKNGNQEENGKVTSVIVIHPS